MKNVFLYSLLSAGLLFMTGCDEKWNAGGSGQGQFKPLVTLDDNAVNSRAAADHDHSTGITANDLKLTLTHHNGKKYTWSSPSEFNPQQEFPIGTYTLEASYGNVSEEGFNKPHFYGISQKFTIRENETSSVTVNATYGNALVCVECSDDFKGYFNDYTVRITSKLGTVIEYSNDENRTAHVAPGNVTVAVTALKPTGATVTYTLDSFTAVAAHHYLLTLDVKNGAGSPQLVLSFDDSLEKEDVWIDLSKDLTNTPAPVIEPVGFENGGLVETVTGNAASGQLEMHIIAQGGFASVILETQDSPSLEKIGWPKWIDLMDATAEERQLLTSLGFREMGLWTNPGTMAVVDLADVCANLHYLTAHNNISKFSLKVIDHLSDGTNHMDSVAVDVRVVQRQIDIQNPSEVFVDQTSMTFEIKSNTPGVSDLQFQYLNNRGTWTTIDSNNVSRELVSSTDGYLYKYNIKSGLPEDVDFKLQVVADNTEGTLLGTHELNIIRSERPFSLTFDERNIFARRGMITVLNNGVPDATLASKAVLYISDDNGVTYTRRPANAIEGANLSLTGLSGNHVYYARIMVDGARSRAISFTTESAAQLVNAGFDDWNTPEKKGDYQYLWSLSGGQWGTLNELTISTFGSGSGIFSYGGTAYRATSGTIPANGRSTKSTASGDTADGHTTGVSNLHSDKQKSGTNAALVRTVGYGKGNNAVSGIARKCENIVPGELYLGEYKDGKPVYGIDFTSRPSSISFYYQYDVVSSNNGDFPTVEVVFYASDNTVLFEKKLDLEVKQDYTEVVIPCEYTINEKAAKFSLIFKSSGNENALKLDTKYLRYPGDANYSGGEYVGSELYIDDVKLNY